MRSLSQPAAERVQKTLVTLVLVLGAIPIALPFCWLVVSSLKTGDRVLTEKPEWLPWRTYDEVRTAEGVQRVKVLDRSRADALGWVRVKPVSEDTDAYFFWPADEIETVSLTGYVAQIGRLKRAVSPPVETETPGQVRVAQLGTQKVQRVGLRELTRADRVDLVVQVLGQAVLVGDQGEGSRDQGIEGSRDRGERDQGIEGSRDQGFVIVEPSGPFDLALSRILDPNGAARVHVDELGADLPVEMLEVNEAAGCGRVRLVPGPAFRIPPGVDVERQAVTRWTLRSGDGEYEVKPTRFDVEGAPVEVALDELREWLVADADVAASTRMEQRMRWFGQPLTVRVLPDVAAPPGMVALATVAPHEAVTVAAERVSSHRSLAPQWANYLRVFEIEPLHKYVLNTLFITALCILGNVLSCGLVGYAFARLQFRGRGALFLVLLSTLMLPSTITFLPTYILYVKIGWLDTFYPLIVPSFLATAAFFVFLYRQYFMTIPLDLEDAARIDGCGPLGTFWHIMLPMARPAVITVTVFTFMGAWNDFMGPLLYLNTDEYQTLAYGLYNFKSAFGVQHPQYMMAGSTLMIVPTLAIFFLAQNAFLRGVVVTGVKG